MSYCRQDDVVSCRPDCWFETEHDCRPRCRNCNIRPIFPSVLQASLIIPQTVIPIRIVITPGVPPVVVPPIISPLRRRSSSKCITITTNSSIWRSYSI